MPVKACSECGQSCISLCPGCKEPVHMGYGFNNGNCSGRHEQKCKPAADIRNAKK